MATRGYEQAMSHDVACQGFARGVAWRQSTPAAAWIPNPEHYEVFCVQNACWGERDMTQTFRRQVLAALVLALAAHVALAQEGKSVDQSKKGIERGSRIYIAPIEGGFDTFLAAAIIKKQVPVTVVTDRTKADYEVTGISSTEKAGWAKMLFMGVDNSNDMASIKVVEIKSNEVVYGYSVRKGNSYRGKQSAAEACAKHLKERIEGGK